MTDNINKVKKLTSSDYKYGFVSNIEEDRIPFGLNINIIQTISKIKKEPKWLLDWRIKEYNMWVKMDEPNWQNLKYPKLIFKRCAIILLPKKRKN